MDDLSSGRELGVALCKALGLNPDEVFRITVIASADDIARLTVEKAIPVPNAAGTVSTIESFAGLKKIRIEEKDHGA